MTKFLVLTASAAMMTFAAPPALPAAAGADPTNQASIEELKTTYLRCERAAMTGGLNDGRVVECSIVYEELKRRAFGNDFRRLRTWYDAAVANAPCGG
jgi:hypothetical protein